MLYFCITDLLNFESEVYEYWDWLWLFFILGFYLIDCENKVTF